MSAVACHKFSVSCRAAVKTTSYDVALTGPFKHSEANLAERPQDPFVKYDAKHSGFFVANNVWGLVFFVGGGGFLFCFLGFCLFVCWIMKIFTSPKECS